MQKIFAPLVFLVWLSTQTLSAATATTTLQLIWPTDMLGLNQEQVIGKAVTYLQTSDFAKSVGQMPNEWKERYANSVGINNYQNSDAITNSIQQNITANTDPEQAGAITISFSNSDSNVALYMAKRCGDAAVKESHYRIAEKSDPAVEKIAQQMEQVLDNVQQLKLQKKISQQQARTPNLRGSSIGAPMGMGPVANPEGVQRQSEMSNIQTQIAAGQQEYNALNRQLQQAVNEAWKGKPKAGLVVVDQADLDAE
ncbi:hypothetical protein [Cerasicoccus arenae]|uniref:Uncharacterized protein n=1 Tax=Cerasicoccus arenae TaxID=424488 RepID=A0A8J3DIZ0_9BACT|nr:hypothetical protein [Cerasicoccus arenae]MBK1858628.1 hypothetical protein [Cerasicoccus arenae]GHC04902.1 hypothetical protein GCM10007047_22230 [Cerasicoccus arenae]